MSFRTTEFEFRYRFWFIVGIQPAVDIGSVQAKNAVLDDFRHGIESAHPSQSRAESYSYATLCSSVTALAAACARIRRFKLGIGFAAELARFQVGTRFITL
jgi:hypothetical protein